MRDPEQVQADECVVAAIKAPRIPRMVSKARGSVRLSSGALLDVESVFAGVFELDAEQVAR